MQAAEMILCFGPWRYDSVSGVLQLTEYSESLAQQLLAGRRELVLEPRLHQLLNYFLQHPQRVLSKTELLDQVWGHDEGSDAALMRAVGLLRKALGDHTKPAVYIETLSKRGYRWVAEVLSANDMAAPAEHTDAAQSGNASEEIAALLNSPKRQLKTTLARRQRVLMLAVFFACAVLALLISLLLFFKQANPNLVFKRQVLLSAMPGSEQLASPLPAEQAMLYQQQQLDQSWRWLFHETVNHTKKPVSDSYQLLSRGQWLDRQFVFAALKNNECWFYRLDPKKLNDEQPWFACYQLSQQGVLVFDDQLWWLDQSQEGSVQLWRLAGQQPVLSVSFADGYRRPQALTSHAGALWILLQQDELNTSLFRLTPGDSEAELVADFPYAFDTISSWDKRRLLMSSDAGVFLFDENSKTLLPLQLPAGSYSSVSRYEHQILATARQTEVTDLLPLEPSDSNPMTVDKPARSSTLLSMSPWLNSNKDDKLLAWSGQQAALVSNRSGLPQIWLYDGQSNVLQLTQFVQWRQISQLIWQQQQLYAVIDQQLYQIDLNNGAQTAVAGHPQMLRRYATCNNKWYWTEFSAKHWVLKTTDNANQQLELLVDALDVRCAPENTLIVLRRDGVLQRYWPANGELKELPVRLSWRELSNDAWQTTDNGLYWLDTHHQLWFMDWQQRTPARLPLNIKETVIALYARAETAQIFLQIRRAGDSDVVWLE